MSNFLGSKYSCQHCLHKRFRGCLLQRWEGHLVKCLGIHGQTSNVRACIAVTPQPDFKCLGMHCCYSMARLQISWCALLLLYNQISNVQACIALTLQADFKYLGVHCSYSVARLVGLPVDIEFVWRGINLR